MPGSYASPGAAYQTGIEDFLAKREVLKHQHLMEQLAVDDETRKQQAEIDNAKYRTESLLSLKQTREAAIADRQAAAAEKAQAAKEKAVNDFQGDIGKRYLPDELYWPEDQARAKKLGIDLPGKHDPDTPQPFAGPLQPGQSEPPVGTGPGEMAPLPGGVRFPGTAVQRQTQAAQGRAQAYTADEANPEHLRQAAAFRLATGENAPAWAGKEEGDPTTGLFTFDSRSGQYKDASGKLVSSIPKGGHVGTISHEPRAAAGGQDEAVDLTPAAIDMLAKHVALGAPMPPMGSGTKGALQRKQVYDRAAQFDTVTGQYMTGTTNPNPPNLATAQTDFKANSGAMIGLQKNLATVNAYTETAHKNAGKLDDVLDDIPEHGSPLLNAPARALALAMGDTKMATAKAYLTSLTAEYARIITTASLNGQLTDSARREQEKVLAPGATREQIRASLKALAAEAENRRISYKAEIDTLRKNIGSGGEKETPAAPATTKPTAAELMKKYSGGD